MEVAQMKKNCTNNENFQYDDLHTHSMYCSTSIMEFKNNLEKLTNSQLNVINYVKKAYEEKQLPFHLFITGGAAYFSLSGFTLKN